MRGGVARSCLRLGSSLRSCSVIRVARCHAFILTRKARSPPRVSNTSFVLFYLFFSSFSGESIARAFPTKKVTKRVEPFSPRDCNFFFFLFPSFSLRTRSLPLWFFDVYTEKRENFTCVPTPFYPLISLTRLLIVARVSRSFLSIGNMYIRVYRFV